MSTFSKIRVLAVSLMITLSAFEAKAGSITLDTPCTVVGAAFHANDQVAFDETMQAARRWIIANDRMKLVQTEEQLQQNAFKGVVWCGGPSPEPGSTLLSAMKKSYEQTAAIAAQVRAQQKLWQDAFDKQRRAQQTYHEQVMRNLGQ